MLNNDLRKPVVLRRINELSESGMSWKGISDTVQKEFDIKADSRTIKNVHSEIVSRRSMEMIKDTSMQREYKESMKRLFKFLEKQTTELKDIWEITVSKNPEDVKVKDIVALSKEIRERLKFISERIDKFEGPTKAQNVNFFQFSQDSMKMIKDYLHLLEQGQFIKKLKSYPFEEGGETIDAEFEVIKDENL